MFNLKSIEIAQEAVVHLEIALAKHLGYKYIIALKDETLAFQLSLETLSPKAEVLCSPLASLSLHRTLCKLSLQPKYIDYKLDATLETRFLQRQLSQQSKCMILSHYQGVITPSEPVQEFCHQHQLILIEDATQALHQHTKSGAVAALFSLNSLLGNDLIPGGVIATDDEQLAEKLSVKVRGGYEKRKNWNYDIINCEPNLQLSIFHANIALKCLETINSDNQKIRHLQTRYQDALSDVKMITLPKQNNLSLERYFVVFLDPALFCPKEDIYNELRNAGIMVEVGLKPIYKTTAFMDESLHLFGAEELYKGVMLLPLHPNMSVGDITHIVNTFKKILDTYTYRGCSF